MGQQATYSPNAPFKGAQTKQLSASGTKSPRSLLFAKGPGHSRRGSIPEGQLLQQATDSPNAPFKETYKTITACALGSPATCTLSSKGAIRTDGVCGLLLQTMDSLNAAQQANKMRQCLSVVETPSKGRLFTQHANPAVHSSGNKG